LPVLFAHVVKGANVRMVKGRYRASFPFEALAQGRVRREFRWQDLDGYGAPESCVTSAVDLPHASAAEEVEKLIRPETCSRRQLQWGSAGLDVKANIDPSAPTAILFVWLSGAGFAPLQ